MRAALSLSFLEFFILSLVRRNAPLYFLLLDPDAGKTKLSRGREGEEEKLDASPRLVVFTVLLFLQKELRKRKTIMESKRALKLK